MANVETLTLDKSQRRCTISAEKGESPDDFHRMLVILLKAITQALADWEDEKKIPYNKSALVKRRQKSKSSVTQRGAAKEI